MVAYKAVSSGSSDGTSVSASAPGGTVAGDLLVAFLTVLPVENTTATLPAGWDLAAGSLEGGFGPSGCVAFHVATGSDGLSINFDVACSSVLGVAAFSDADSGAPPADAAQTEEFSIATMEAPSILAPSAGLLICAAGGAPDDFASATTWTAPAGMTEIVDLQQAAGGASMSIAYQTVSGAGATGAKTFTASGPQYLPIGMSAFIGPPIPKPRSRAYVSPTAVHRASRW